MQFINFNYQSRTIENVRMERLKRIMFIKHIFKVLLLKAAKQNYKLSPQHQIYINYKLNKFPRYASITQQNTRCFRTGRTNMPFRFCLLSRMHMRLYSKLGLLSHYSKAVF